MGSKKEEEMNGSKSGMQQIPALDRIHEELYVQFNS